MGCNTFTTLRLEQGDKYQIGNLYDIYLNEEYLGRARCEDKKVLYLEKINDFIGFLDTGYNAAETKKIIQRMYNKENPLMALVLLKWIKRDSYPAPHGKQGVI